MEVDYFIAGPEMEADKVASAKTTQKIQNDYSDVFTGLRCFKDTFFLQIKDGMKLYQTPTRHVAYSLWEPFRKKAMRGTDNSTTRGG